MVGNEYFHLASATHPPPAGTERMRSKREVVGNEYIHLAPATLCHAGFPVLRSELSLDGLGGRRDGVDGVPKATPAQGHARVHVRVCPVCQVG